MGQSPGFFELYGALYRIFSFRKRSQKFSVHVPEAAPKCTSHSPEKKNGFLPVFAQQAGSDLFLQKVQ